MKLSIFIVPTVIGLGAGMAAADGLPADDLEPETPADLAIATGVLSIDRIDRVVRAGMMQGEACYRDKGAGKSGVVTLGWLIDAGGKVAHPMVTMTTLSNAELNSCLLEVLGGWQFPVATPPGVTTVSYPFVFGDAQLQTSDRPLPRAVVGAFVEHRKDEVVACGGGRVKGTIEVLWSVAPLGHVTGLRLVRSTVNDKAVDACILETISHWQFPPTRSRRSVVVAYPFVLVLEDAPRKEGGALEGNVLQRVIDDGRAAILACYDHELQFDAGLKGTIEVAWQIAPNGSVREPAVSAQTVNNRRFESCVVDTVASWKFPPFSGPPMTVSFPFVFEPS